MAERQYLENHSEFPKVNRMPHDSETLVKLSRL